MLCQSDYEDYDFHECDKGCSECEDHSERYLHAKEFMEAVVKQLYNGKELDVLELEGDLDELCHYFDIPLKYGDLKIERLRRSQYVA